MNYFAYSEHYRRNHRFSPLLKPKRSKLKCFQEKYKEKAASIYADGSSTRSNEAQTIYRWSCTHVWLRSNNVNNRERVKKRDLQTLKNKEAFFLSTETVWNARTWSDSNAVKKKIRVCSRVNEDTWSNDSRIFRFEFFTFKVVSCLPFAECLCILYLIVGVF